MVRIHSMAGGLSMLLALAAGSVGQTAEGPAERIGNPDDPDDIDVITKGISMVDPRWHRAHDTQKKFVVQMPLRDGLQKRIPSYAALFQPADAAHVHSGGAALPQTGIRE